MNLNRNKIFRDLHFSERPFVLANAWDTGTTRILTHLGAEAIGTTSVGQAFVLGREDMGYVNREEALAHAKQIAEATDLPVSGDFENGFGHAPEYVAETVNLAHKAGLSGISIEDIRLPEATAYDFDFAVQRIRACAEASKRLEGDFVLVARADGVMNGLYDFSEALKRVKAFAEVGADCVYVPEPGSLENLRQIVSSVSVPVNALSCGSFSHLTLDDFANAGVARVSLGSGLLRLSQTAFLNASKEILENGEFKTFQGNLPGKEIDQWLTGKKEP